MSNRNENREGRICAVCGEFYTIAEGASVFTVCSDKCFYGPPRAESECGSSHWCTVHHRDVLECFYDMKSSYELANGIGSSLERQLLAEREAHEKTNEILRQATGNKFSSSGDHDLHCRCNANLTELVDQHERAFAEIERLRAALQNIANSAYTDNTFVKIARNALGLESK